LVSHTKEENTLKAFEIRVMRIIGSKREEVAGSWRRLHNEELRNLYASPYIIRVIK
jgi:putative cell wall-binding protein